MPKEQLEYESSWPFEGFIVPMRTFTHMAACPQNGTSLTRIDVKNKAAGATPSTPAVSKNGFSLGHHINPNSPSSPAKQRAANAMAEYPQNGTSLTRIDVKNKAAGAMPSTPAVGKHGFSLGYYRIRNAQSSRCLIHRHNNIRRCRGLSRAVPATVVFEEKTRRD